MRLRPVCISLVIGSAAFLFSTQLLYCSNVIAADLRSTAARAATVSRDVSNRRDERTPQNVSVLHNVSTITTTVRIPVRIDSKGNLDSSQGTRDQRQSDLLAKLLSSAPSSDSPNSTPGIDAERAANSNLNLYEVIAASFIRGHQFDQESLKNLDTTEVVLGPQSHQNVFHLSQGNVLFAPKKDIEVLTNLGSIHIGAGSVVCVMKPSQETVSVYDLDDGANKKVTIHLADELLTLSPGKQLVVTNQSKQFSEVNPSPRIHYRKATRTTMASGLHVHSAQFSIPAAVLTIKPLRSMLLSNDIHDRKLTNRLLKDVVILEDLFNDPEPYRMCENPLMNKISTNVH
jgi:hypothetical protein